MNQGNKHGFKSALEPTKTPGAWGLMVELFRPHRWALLAAFSFNAIHGFAITFQVFTVGWFVDWVLGKGDIPPNMWGRLSTLALGYFFTSTFGRMLCWHVGYRIFTRVREHVVAELRERFFRQLNALCLRFHMKRGSGELFSYLFGSPMQNIVGFYQHCSTGLAGAITTIGSAVSILLWTDPILTFALAGTVCFHVYMMNRARKANRRIHLEYQKLESAVSGTVADILRGTRAVKIHAMEKMIEGEFGQQIKRISRKSYERDIRWHIEYMKQETIFYVGFTLMLASCAWSFSSGRITIGEVSMFLLAFQQLSAPLTLIAQAFALWGSAQASLERISEVFRVSSSTPDPVNPLPVPPAGEIEMKDVRFKYDDKEILRGVSFCIPYGQSVALVGPSGSGKSTIAQLLLRLYDPDSGSVVFGGQDLRFCKGSEVRRRFGVVPQDPFIFQTSLRQNIKVAKPDATDEEIERACRLANAWEFIEKLPRGLDTIVGEGGANLSGGQRQRIAIARAILVNPPVFLFDEATSALDTLSEKVIQETIRTVCKGRTTIIIAHRLATVKGCDRILVILDGQIIQDGNYERLMASEGLFRDMVEGQQLVG